LTTNLVTKYRLGMARRSAAATARAASGEEPPASGDGRGSGDGTGRPRHAADPIFEQLAEAIIEGSLPPGSALPPERELAERFGVSRLIARQAVHRLADVGLARVRQGGATIVVHPNDARDLRVIELVYRAGRGSPRDMRELIERQFLHGYSLLFLASKRASPERLQAIARMAREYVARGAPADEMMDFEKRFFTALAEATDNRFYMLETSWWFRMTEGRHGRPAAFSDEQRAAFYQEIVQRLLDGRDAARFYIDTLSPLLDALGSFALRSKVDPKP
jgi:DNA-binding FadR family transcriptional regulator